MGILSTSDRSGQASLQPDITPTHQPSMSISSWFSSSSPSPSPSSSPASSQALTPSTSTEPVVKASVNKFVSEKNPEGVKPCCACPETKKARDDCFLKYGSNIDEDGESRAKCQDIVARHRECMRSYGFNV